MVVVATLRQSPGQGGGGQERQGLYKTKQQQSGSQWRDQKATTKLLRWVAKCAARQRLAAFCETSVAPRGVSRRVIVTFPC